MPGTKAGAKKAMETIKKRYGQDENGKSLLHKAVGAIGGATSTNTGFALMDKEKHREVSKKGGSKSRRTQRMSS